MKKVIVHTTMAKKNDDQKIYASMTQMSSNDKRSSEKYGDSSQLTNWILDSRATCDMTPEVSDFIPGSLEDKDKYIEVADEHHVTAKQKGQVQIKCVTITESLSSQHYTTYFWHQTCVTDYFP